MKKTILLSLLVSLLIVVACGKNNTSGKSKGPGSTVSNPVMPGGPILNMDNTAEQLLARINERRVSWGIRPLERDYTLDKYAQTQASDLADGRREYRRFSRICEHIPASMRGSLCGEVRHVGSRPSVEYVFRDWLKEIKTREVLETRVHARAGIGFAQLRNGDQAWVVLMTSDI